LLAEVAGATKRMAWDQVPVILVTVVLAVLAGTTYDSRRTEDVHLRIDHLREDINTHLGSSGRT